MKNELSPLGRKIFLDRYALKDVQKETLVEGDIVVAVSNNQTGQREIGVVTGLGVGDAITVKLDDETILNVKKDDVDKPLETDPAQMLSRVAKGIASQEKPAVRSKWEKEFNWLLEDWKFVPGGRILTGAGTDQNLTYFNCYVIPSPKDSRGGIISSLGQMTEIMSRGGGVGMNISSLRPRHCYVKGVNGRSSGSVSWGGLFSFVTGLIEQGGSRRGALMLILNVWHPDIIDFINSKREMGKITNANISVGITDDFMEAVKNDGTWETCFPDTTDPEYNQTWNGDINAWKAAGKKVIPYQTLKARDVWNAIIESAWASAEPGVFFIDRYNKMSNSWYYCTIQSTNPCGEQGLPPWGVCNLGSINLSKFVENKKVLFEDLGRTVRDAVRFLDNVIDDTPYFFEENKKQQQSERRIGLGTMGLADMLIKLELAYGSPDSLVFIDKLYRFICEEAYLESASLAEEKGSFSYFDADKLLESGFMKQMPDNIRKEVKEKGLRNVTLLTQAPTGTTGTMVNTSTGIEPYYFWEWERTGRMGSNIERVAVYDEWVKAHPGEKRPHYFVSAMDLAPEGHVKVQAAIQKWVDSSISKTGNTPKEYTVEQTAKLYELLYDLGCKGGTTYRDGSRDTQVLTARTEEKEPEETVAPAMVLSEPKSRVRSTVLRGTTYRKATPIGTAYITVNCDGPNPSDLFEVFINVAKVGSDVAADAEGLGRLISLILRMPSPLNPEQRAQAIIAQLAGIGSGRSMGFGKNRVMSLADAVAQVLQQHLGSLESQKPVANLPDEEDEPVDAGQLDLGLPPSVNSVKPDICPICGNVTFVNIEGCKKCFSCGHSEC
ncbi:adenosylcobalamin-dependent ribonucleoside-diphosphate reductase [uncultured Sphaerochaeta sp.]|uniref:adenosylcobalamin-dependent ribonucleoside-diphosphate reductase n=1 Tax=uncultured Sphaerochaeta sp. TaxID=886478 RepID=UPI002A0A5D06|nr:adenosylcobalamin-dependent ribonucleoside-diphosphate reductase [uncultured Sphaerochaeta sp.]